MQENDRKTGAHRSADMKRSGLTLKRAGGLFALGGTAILGLAVLTSQGVVARGNPSFEGVISAADPTGFMSSPDTYNISNGAVTVNFDVSTYNLTDQTQTIGLNFSAHHILTYNGICLLYTSRCV